MKKVLLSLALLPILFVGCSARYVGPTKRADWAFHAKPMPKISPNAVKHKEVVVLDAGHGGKDKGANSSKPRYLEKELTLKTTRLVKGYLEALGYPVVLTRNSDTFISLDERAEIANERKASLFVSIHYNTCPNPEAHGIEIFYFKGENDTSKRMAESKRCCQEVLSALTYHTGAAARGVKRANFAVIRKTQMPAILVEAGFLSNEMELERIKSDEYLRFVSWGIAKGINNYLNP